MSAQKNCVGNMDKRLAGEMDAMRDGLLSHKKNIGDIDMGFE